MDTPHVYEFRVTEHLTARWTEWFDGLAMHNEPGGATVLRGPVADGAALFGVLAKIQALNLTLVSVNRVEETESA
jgi:hypothetical protein